MLLISSPRSILCRLLPLTIVPFALNLCGCGLNDGPISTTKTGSPLAPGAVYQGKAYGGEQPLVGATIQLYAAGAPATGGGYGQGATALIPTANEPTTDVNGSFVVTGLYTCPLTPAVSQVYIVASGGSSGAGNPANPKVALMAALGSCTAGSTLSSNLYIWINEVTTVASVYALQQFMAAPSASNTGAPSIGAPGNTYNGVQSAVLGLQNAFGMVNNLVNISTGSAAMPTNSWATPDNDGLNINTLADILASCVNSNPSSSTACSTLFTDATPSGSFTAADTVQAAWYIAQNPGHNVSTLYRLISPTPPFTALSTTPNDFTLAVNLAPQYTPVATATYAVDTPHNIAIDAYGNVWVNNVHGTSGISSGLAAAAQASVVELNPNGSVLMTPVTSFTASTTGGTYSQFTTRPSTTVSISAGSRMLAIDNSNNVWVANYSSSLGTPAAGSVANFNGSTGLGVAGSVKGGYFVGSSPWGLAIDGHNNVYVSNTGNTGMDPLSIGKFALGTGTYSYSTSGGATATQSLPNVKAVTGGSGSFNYYGAGTWSAVMAVDTNTGVTSGTDGILWTASPQCVTSSSMYDTGNNIAWGIVSQFNADTLTALSESQATTNFSGATAGVGSTTNCGSTTTGTNGDVALSGTGLQIGQVFTAAMASPYGIAIDKNNGVWIADGSYSSNTPGFNGLTYLGAPSASSGLISNSAYITNGSALTSGNTSPSQGQTQRETAYIAVDGNNNVWGANQGFPTLFEASYNSTTNTITYLVPATTEGFAHTLSSAIGVAIDLSGNVWVTNTNTTSTYTGQAGGPATPPIGASLTVLVGEAGPVLTPLSQAVASSMLGQKP